MPFFANLSPYLFLFILYEAVTISSSICKRQYELIKNVTSFYTASFYRAFTTTWNIET